MREIAQSFIFRLFVFTAAQKNTFDSRFLPPDVGWTDGRTGRAVVNFAPDSFPTKFFIYLFFCYFIQNVSAYFTSPYKFDIFIDIQMYMKVKYTFSMILLFYFSIFANVCVELSRLAKFQKFQKKSCLHNKSLDLY